LRMTRVSGAFTLIELLIVVAIIAILAAIAVPNFLEAQMRAKVSRVVSDQRSVATALEAYAVDNQKYPPARSAFVDPLLMTETWRLTTPIAYMTEIPKDTFHNPQPFGLSGGPFGPGGRYMHYISDPLVTEIWLLWSYGPDRDVEFGHLVYDPTNGSISDGDIYRVGAQP